MELEELKKQNEAPEWLDDIGYSTLTNGYLMQNETPRQMWERISKASASYQKNQDWKEYFNLFWNNWLCASTPILTNSGTDRGLNISCYGQNVSDSLASIFDNLKETAMLTKNGGGIGKYYGNVRGRGSEIKGNGKSQGIIPWLKIEDSAIISLSQGSSRRGSEAIYLDINHPDIEEFLEIRKPTGDINRRCINLHTAVCIDNKFMNDIISGDKSKRNLWSKLLEMRFTTGSPYIQYTDNINDNNPECYNHHGLKVTHSQLCVAPETKILTDKGYVTISEYENQKINVWNGKEFSETTVIKTGENQKLINVIVKVINAKNLIRDIRVLCCTEYHKFYDNNNNEIIAKDLKSGIKLKSLNFENTDYYYFVLDVIDTNRISDTYCVNEPKEHKAVFNGILTGNCNEIMLHSSDTETYVCCLSSMNLARWNEWKETNAVNLAIRFLDGQMSEFIDKASKQIGLEKAVRFSERHRALGLGALGFHSLLQQRDISFESLQAKILNTQIFKHLDIESKKATKELALEYGEPFYCKGFGIRNTHRLAIAPTTSNAIISGDVSQSIEPWASNVFAQKTAKGTFIRKNRSLQKLLKELNKDTIEVWNEINENQGSVKTLDFLTEEQKEVFKTAREINQHIIVKLASDRQKFIDQGQSLNLFFDTTADPKYINEVHLEAWKQGLKGLYYVRSSTVIKGDSIDYKSASDCTYCES